MKTRLTLRIGFIIGLACLTLMMAWGALKTSPAHAQLDVTVVANPTTGGWQNLGLYGARAADAPGGITIDASNDTVYVCTAGVYGIYKTTTGGASWQPVTNTLGA